jgi:alpha/beta superfamily hydrolase
MRLQTVGFFSQEAEPVQLEGLLYPMEGNGPWPAAIVCHPHPLGGGTMRNAVVAAMARALSARGVVTLRFNFRGVGESGGTHDNGRGEQADVGGALDWLCARPEVDPGRLYVTGYSFGAWVGLAHAQRDPRVAAVAAVGLVPWHVGLDLFQAAARSQAGSGLGQFDPDFLRTFTRPKIFVTGERDVFAPPELVKGLVDRLSPPKMLQIISGTDHFFEGHHQDVGALVADFLDGV